MKFSFFTFLILISSASYASGFGAEVSQKSKTPDKFINLPKEASYINFDSFNGSLNTGFKLPIPKVENELSKSIHFAYNSTRYRNLGYGLGFEFATSRFYKNPLTLRANYIFEHNGKAIEYNFDESSGIGHEAELTFFTKAKYNNDKSQIIISFPEGKRLFFNSSNGNLLREESSFKSSFLTYEWDNGLISKIKSYNNLTISFEYSDCKYEEKSKYLFAYGAHYKGAFINTKKCLSSVNYDNEKDVKKVVLSYSDSHLVKVIWEGNELTKIFTAKYANTEFNEDNVSNRIEETKKTISGSPSKDNVLISKGKFGQQFINRDKIVRDLQLRPAHEGAKFSDSIELANTYFADFDNDGVTDVIVESMQHIMGIKDEDIISNDDYGDDEDDARIPEFGAHHINVFRGEVNQSTGAYSLINNSPYQLSGSFKTMVPTCMWHSEDHKHPRENLCNQSSSDDWDYYSRFTPFDEAYRFQTFSHSSLLLGDFNGDGAIDVASCGANNYISYNGYSKFSPAKRHSFPCTSSSTAIDINQDGLSDIVSGKGVYINNGNENFTKLSNDDDFSELITYHQKVHQANGIVRSGENSSGNQSKLNSLSDKYKDKTVFRKHPSDKFELVADSNFQFQAINAKSRHTITYESEDSKWKESSHYGYKKISTFTNMYDGDVDVKYTVNGPKSVLKETTTSNLEIKKKTDFLYAQPIFEPVLNQFIGFQALKKSNSGLKDVNDNIYYIFYTDIKLSDNLKRVPIHGQVDTIAHCEENKCSLLDKIFDNQDFSEIDFNQAKSLKRNDWKVKYHNDLFSSPTYFKYNFKTIELTNYSNNQTVKTNENIYEQYSQNGPLKHKSRILEGANLPYPVGGSSVVPYQETIRQFKVSNGRKLIHSISENNFSNSNLPIKETNYSYILDNNEVRQVSVSQGINTQKVEFDKFGRQIKAISANGDVTTTKYTHIEENQIVTENNNTISTTNYDVLRSTLSKTIVNQAESVNLSTTFKYSQPFILDTVTHDDKTYSYDFKNNNNLIVTVTNEATESVMTLVYDQLGNITKTMKKNKGEAERLISKHVFNASSKKIEEYLPNDVNDEKLHYTFKYDILGRIENKTDHVSNTVSRSEYKDASLLFFINDQLLYKKRLTQTGVLANFEISDDNFEIDQTISKNIISIKSDFDELHYKYDQNNNVSTINNSIGRTIYKEDNALLTRTVNDAITYTKNSRDNITKFEEEDYYTINLKHDSLNRLKTIDNSLYNSNRTFEYSNTGQMKKDSILIDGQNLIKEVLFNKEDQLEKETLTLSDSKLELNYKYKNGRPSSIDNYVSSLEYDDYGYLSKIEYSNGTIVNYNYSSNGKLISFAVGDYKETNLYDSFGKVFKIVSNINPNKAEVTQVFEYTDDLRLKNKPSLKNNSNTIKRNENFSFSLNDVFSDNSRVIEAEGLEVVAQGFDQTLGLLSSQETIRYFSKELHYRNGTFTRYMFIANKLIGAFTINKDQVKFYPIVSDSRNSVRLAFDGSNIALMKNYNAWGELDKSTSSAKYNVEKNIQYDYALLKRHNLNSKYLISNSRLYFPAMGEWITIDPLLFSSPAKLLSQSIFEANGFIYAGGDPLNFIDPSGNFAEPVSATALIGIAGLTIGATGVAAYGIGRGALFLGNFLGGISDADYNSRVHSMNEGAAKAWNAVYKPIVENTAGLAGKLGFAASAGKGLLNAYTGRDMLHADSFDGFRFGQKKINGPQRLWEATSPVMGKMVGKMTEAMPMGWKFATESYWFGVDKIMAGSAESVGFYDDGFRFYNTQPSYNSYDSYNYDYGNSYYYNYNWNY